MTEKFQASLTPADTGSIDPSLTAPMATDVDHEKELRLEAAEQWLGTQAGSPLTYPDVIAVATANDEPIPAPFNQTEPVPAAIASEVALIAQQRLRMWNKHDIMADDLGNGLEIIRTQAINIAETLDFGVVEASLPGDWPLRAKLNAMHDKFKGTTSETIEKYIGTGAGREYKALYIRNIIAGNAPDLLTPDLKTMMNPETPQWLASSKHAEILFRNRSAPNLNDYAIDELPTTLPTSDGMNFRAEDAAAMKSVASMDDVELAMYARPGAIAEIRERGRMEFKDLTLAAQESLLTRRFYELSAKSQDPTVKQAASERNKALQGEPVLQEGDFVHATFTPQVLEKILDRGLQCGEAVIGNTRGLVNFPFTVSFLGVTAEKVAPASLPERLVGLKNSSYGPINIVLERDQNATDANTAQTIGGGVQHRVFGGVPATEIKSIVIRDEGAPADTADGVIQAIVKNGMFIPVYSGSTGELILSSEEFESYRRAPSRIGKLALRET